MLIMQKITKEELNEMVYTCVKKVLCESGFFDNAKEKIRQFGNKFDGYRDGQPENIKDVIEGNGWEFPVGKMEHTANGQECLIYKCPNSHSLSPKELIEDLNIFFQDKGYNMKAFIKYDGDYYYKLILKKF